MYLVMRSLFFSDMKSLRLGLSTLDDNVKNDARKITNKAVHTAEVYYIEGYAIKIC